MGVDSKGFQRAKPFEIPPLSRGEAARKVVFIGLFLLCTTMPGISWAAFSLVPQGPTIADESFVAMPFWVSYDYHTATDLDTDTGVISGQSSRMGMGWQGCVASVDISVRGFWARQFGKMTYHEGADFVEIRQNQISRGGHLDIGHDWGYVSLGLTETGSGGQSMGVPSYEALLRPLSWLGLGAFSGSELSYRSVHGQFDGGDPLSYDMNSNLRREGFLSELDLYGMIVRYRVGALALEDVSVKDAGYLDLVGTGGLQSFSLQTRGAQSWRLEVDRSELSGKGALYSEHGTTQVRLRWGSGVLTRIYLGFVSEGDFRWQLGIEDNGIQVKDVLLQTVNDWEGGYGDAVGRKHFSNDQTDYRIQQLSADWESDSGFSGGLTLGRMAFLGNYREYETPLFFTYYVGTYFADIEELDYLTLRLKQSWEVSASVRVFVEGRQFIPFRIVKSGNASNPAAGSGEGGSQGSSDVSGLRWSGFELGAGVSFYF